MEAAKADVPSTPFTWEPWPQAKSNVIDRPPTARITGIQFGLLSIKETDRLSAIGTNQQGLKEGITKWTELFDARLGIPNKEQKCFTCGGTTRGGCDRPNSCDGHFGHISLPYPIYHPHYVRKCEKILSSICLGCSRFLEKKKRKNALDGLFEDETLREHGKGNSECRKATGKRKAGASATGSRKRKCKEKSTPVPGLAELLFQGLESRKLKQELGDSRRLNFYGQGFPQAQQQCKEEPTEITDSFMHFAEPEVVPGEARRAAVSLEEAQPPELPSDEGQSPQVPQGGAQSFCKYCMGPNGELRSKLPKVKVRVVSKLVGRKGRVDTLMLVVDEKAGVLPNGFWDFVKGHPTNFKDKTRKLLPAEALRILKRIPEDDIPKLQMHAAVSRPDALITRQMPVSPNCNRLIMEDWASTAQPKVLMRRGRQNAKLEALVKKTKQIKDTRSGRIDFAEAEENGEELQLHAGRHYRSFKVVEYKMATGQEIEETGGSLEHKWLKANVLSKRSNQSARTVINGDPCVMIGEIGIPREIAQRLTVEETINRLNIRKWQRCVNEYINRDKKPMPGAFVLKKRTESQQRDLEVLKGKMHGKNLRTMGLKLELGDIITRCLRDGDPVFANRPPSLHKHSLIAFKVKVHPLSTFAINPLICAPFDADFDGDAFHIFVPQSFGSLAELEELMSVRQQMVCPQGGQALIGLSQDSLVGGHLLTKSHIFLSRVDMNQLSMCCSCRMPVPAIVKSPNETGPLWTGKQLFSITLPSGFDFGNLSWTGKLSGMRTPSGFNYSPEGEVLIRDGEVLICQGGAKWLDRSPNGIVRALCDQLGPLAALEHLNCLQDVVHQWLLVRGFSVGLLDYHGGSHASARKKMREGIEKSLRRANEASLKQVLSLDRQVQERLLHPRPGGTSGCKFEHQGCFGLLLGDIKTSQKVTELQGAAVESFQSLAPAIENLVTGYMERNNSLLAMVRSGSKGSVSKLIQQAGCLGLQLYKGESILPLQCGNKLTYFQTSLEKAKSEVFSQAKSDFSEVGYWESRGVIANSYFDGLNPLEFFIDIVASRCNVQRQGIEEPNLILKSLMLFMRDMYIAYDGTVRNRGGMRVVQFQYGGVKECLQGNSKVAECASSQVNEQPPESWVDSELAGEPVGALAATAIAEPAYNVKMQSIHQTQLLGSGPVQLLKEILLPRVKTKSKFNDRRSILRFPQGFGKERRALEIQNGLQKVLLETITLTTTIEYCKLDDKLFAKDESKKDTLFSRWSPWIAHLLLCKKSVEKNELRIDKVVALLNRKYSGNTVGDIYFAYSANCLPKVHQQGSRLCIWFFPVLPPDTDVLPEEVRQERMALVLESMKTTMLPAILNTSIKGSDDIESVRILWEDKGAAFGLPHVTSSYQPFSMSQERRSDPGELVVEVVVKATKGAGKRGAAWRTLTEACIGIMHLIDWRRSGPYSIQEIYHVYGLEAAHQNIVKRLILATKTMGKPVLQKHLILVADTMTHTGDVIGLGAAGYRDFCRDLNISTPFTEAAFKEPKKVFLNAAAQGASENLDGILPSAVFGRRIPLGTGIDFKLEYQVPKAKGENWPVDPFCHKFRQRQASTLKPKAHGKPSEVDKTINGPSTCASGKQYQQADVLPSKSPPFVVAETASRKQYQPAIALASKSPLSGVVDNPRPMVDGKGNDGCIDKFMIAKRQPIPTMETANCTASRGLLQGHGISAKQVGNRIDHSVEDGIKISGKQTVRKQIVQRLEDGKEILDKQTGCKRILEDGHENFGRQTGRKRIVQRVEDGEEGSGNRKGCKRIIQNVEDENKVSGDRPRKAAKVQGNVGLPCIEGDPAQNMQSREHENEEADEPSKSAQVHEQKTNFGLREMEGDPAVIRVNDPRRVTWSVQSHLDGVVLREIKTTPSDDKSSVGGRLAHPSPANISCLLVQSHHEASAEVPLLNSESLPEIFSLQCETSAEITSLQFDVPAKVPGPTCDAASVKFTQRMGGHIGPEKSSHQIRSSSSEESAENPCFHNDASPSSDAFPSLNCGVSTEISSLDGKASPETPSLKLRVSPRVSASQCEASLETRSSNLPVVPRISSLQCEASSETRSPKLGVSPRISSLQFEASPGNRSPNLGVSPSIYSLQCKASPETPSPNGVSPRISSLQCKASHEIPSPNLGVSPRICLVQCEASSETLSSNSGLSPKISAPNHDAGYMSHPHEAVSTGSDKGGTSNNSKKKADEPPASSWSGKWFSMIRKIPGKLFASSSRNSEASPETEPVKATVGYLEKATGTLNRPSGVHFQEARDQQTMHVKEAPNQESMHVGKVGAGQSTRVGPTINDNVGCSQTEAAEKDFEQRVIDEKKELQNLLHVRYKPGERVDREDEKMVLDEVLVHHPHRAEKVGCGIAYVKVDYHPEYPTSKCFHIVRKDGSSSDFSYHKCLDNKLFELGRSKQA